MYSKSSQRNIMSMAVMNLGILNTEIIVNSVINGEYRHENSPRNYYGQYYRE